MSLLDGPDNEVYRLTKGGTLALLDAVNAADKQGAAAKASKDQPCEAVTAYLDVAFLGSFLRSGKEIPYMWNAGVLGTYIDFMDHELERGALHATPVHQAYLKLLAYVTAIEAAAPLSLFGNCLEYLAGKRSAFEFDIYYDLPSANKKLEAVSRAFKDVRALKGIRAVPTQFKKLHGRLRKLIDPVFRNAIAHSTYRVHSDQGRVDIWNRGDRVQSRTFKEVDEVYLDARCYLQGFTAAIRDFAYQLHPECPYIWRS